MNISCNNDYLKHGGYYVGGGVSPNETGINMSQSERIAKIHFLLSRGQVTTGDLMETFEVSRATVMRDIELMRDRLGSPITYDPKKKSYYYSTDENGEIDYEIDYQSKFDLPGIWIDKKRRLCSTYTA